MKNIPQVLQERYCGTSGCLQESITPSPKSERGLFVMLMYKARVDCFSSKGPEADIKCNSTMQIPHLNEYLTIDFAVPFSRSICQNKYLQVIMDYFIKQQFQFWRQILKFKMVESRFGIPQSFFQITFEIMSRRIFL